MSGPALDDAALDLLFREARSYKRFQPEPVGDDLIHEIYELAKFGPTSANSTPARFLFLTSLEAREKLAALSDESNRAKVLSAPCMVIIGHDLDFRDQMTTLAPHSATASSGWPTEEERAFEALRSGSLQGAYLMLAARALGLDCGPMGGFDHDGVDAAFFAGTRIRSNFMCGLGYGTEEKLRPRAPRLAFDLAAKIL